MNYLDKEDATLQERYWKYLQQRNILIGEIGNSNVISYYLTIRFDFKPQEFSLDNYRKGKMKL